MNAPVLPAIALFLVPAATQAQSSLVADVLPGSGDGTFGNSVMAALGDRVLFTASDTALGGLDLWVSDGTSTGTQLVKATDPGGPAYPAFLTALRRSGALHRRRTERARAVRHRRHGGGHARADAGGHALSGGEHDRGRRAGRLRGLRGAVRAQPRPVAHRRNAGGHGRGGADRHARARRCRRRGAAHGGLPGRGVLSRPRPHRQGPLQERWHRRRHGAGQGLRGALGPAGPVDRGGRHALLRGRHAGRRARALEERRDDRRNGAGEGPRPRPPTPRRPGGWRPWRTAGWSLPPSRTSTGATPSRSGSPTEPTRGRSSCIPT